MRHRLPAKSAYMPTAKTTTEIGLSEPGHDPAKGHSPIPNGAGSGDIGAGSGDIGGNTCI